MKIRKTKKKRNKENITPKRQGKSQETDDIWEIPSDYSSHNSEQFTSDYGSTYNYQTIEEKQKQLSPTKNNLKMKKRTTSKKKQKNQCSMKITKTN